MITIKDVDGYKDSKSALKKFITGTFHSTINVLRGELLTEIEERNDHFNYQLHRDPKVHLFCTVDEVAPLSHQEFLMLEAIKKPEDRANALEEKLDWGLQMHVGSTVNVTLTGSNVAVQTQSRSLIHYKGPIGNLPGVYFGIELLVSL